MTLHPAETWTGIRFQRSDIPGDAGLVPALWQFVHDTQMCTTLANDDGVRIGTVEHLMAALSGCGVDNVLIELDGPEVPAMDGSAAPFVHLIDRIGLVEQDVPRRAIKVCKPVVIDDGTRRAALLPYDGFEVKFEIDFESRAIKRQACRFEVDSNVFMDEIASARTFGFLHEVDKLRSLGLALGGSLDNAVVVSGDAVINEGGLRFDDEFVRHKALDAIGDLYLAGGPILGRYEGVQSGHQLNNSLLRALFADDEAWCRVELGAAVETPERVAVAL